MLWQATSRHQEQLLSLASVATSQQTGTAGKSHPWGKIHQPLSSCSHPFSNLPASTFMWISAHHLHLDTQKPLCSAQQDVSFFFFFSKTPHIYLYRKLQPYTVLTLFSILIFTAATHNYLRFHPSDLQFLTLIWPFTGCGRSACRCSRAIVCLFVCYLALNLMTAVSGS